MIDSKLLIQKINAASQLEEIIDVHDLKKQYRTIVKALHPDLCDTEDAIAALIKVNQLKADFDIRYKMEDDAGEYKMKGLKIIFNGDGDLLNTSYENYYKLRGIRDHNAISFHRYLPKEFWIDCALNAALEHRAVPLRNLTLPQEHVNWILSRMLEICAWFSQCGFVHAGINPNSVLVVPETHGIIIGSFYHMKKKGTTLDTISAAYQNWYPTAIFKNKKAQTIIDLELCKRTAAYLLGDKSGVGIKLKKTHHPGFIDFLLQQHTNAFQCYDDYRKLLRNNFDRKFHPLNI